MTQTATQAAVLMALNAPDTPRGEMLRRIMGANVPMHTQMYLLHKLMDTPAPDSPVALSVSDRHQRLHYIMSEFIELVTASGFALVDRSYRGDFGLAQPLDKHTLAIEHIEGSIQDPIEMVDGLHDILVTTLGMLVEMGQTQHIPAAFREVVAGSVTKLNPDTLQIDKNHCVKEGCDDDDHLGCHDLTHMQVPGEPRGKWLKGRDYVAPQLAQIINLPKELES